MTRLHTLGAIMGIIDVDPFVMGLTQAPRTVIPLRVAAGEGLTTS